MRRQLIGRVDGDPPFGKRGKQRGGEDAVHAFGKPRVVRFQCGAPGRALLHGHHDGGTAAVQPVQQAERRDDLGQKLDPATGWAVGGKVGQVHHLSLMLDEAMDLGAGTLRLTFAQQSKFAHHTFTHLRLELTGDRDALRWAPVPTAIRGLIRKGSLSMGEQRRLAQFYRSIAPELAKQRELLAKKEKQLKEMKPHTTVPVMVEVADKDRRETHIHLRGSYLSHGEQVLAGTPAVFHPLRGDLPRNRLALAHWLVDPENPLTARVVANRQWEQIFGIGLVETSEEFGSQGELPSHPELLDWLAVELQDTLGWDLKEFLKMLVTSRTYRQSSQVSAELLEVDPFNRYYARGPRFRISAEMIRDQALFVSGLLSEKMYGNPVNPPQPNLGLKAAFGGATDWKTSEGEDRYRRGMYTTWRRSSPYPSMATFDAPNREVCTVRRGRTNTPLQALVTLNDPVYLEAAEALGRRIIETSLAEMIREVLSREPQRDELEMLGGLYDQSYEQFRQAPEQTQLFLQKEDEVDDPAALAAWTVVGNVLLNLDELFLKR
ncbi:MAG: DUF1553 domain-containing protein [Verrucomicrobiota bacterium]